MFFDYKNYKTNKLTIKQRSLVDSIDGLILETNMIKFIKHIEYIKQYIKDKQRLPSETEYRAVNNIRTKYRDNELTEEHRKIVESIEGLIVIEDAFTKHIENIKKFKEEKGRIPLEKEYKMISTIRQNYKNNKLTAEQMAICDEIEGLIIKK